eukprot:TRINITY_DN14290_c0_g2_i1.p1 TRINITY_DN14290_c0_g2~~TRINITY_DN14290_c0_g2_i1.p1  ORF type:complete len:638 (-),score=107.21 TRINITY_DN14290_c0_g2_i1:344-2257(-)
MLPKFCQLVLIIGAVDLTCGSDHSYEAVDVHKLAEQLAGESGADVERLLGMDGPTVSDAFVDAPLGSKLGGKAFASGNQRSGAGAALADAMSVQTLRSLPTSSVFKIFVTGATRSYTLPWQVQQQHEWTGSGFAVTDKLILTNAHVVLSNHHVEVIKQDGAERFQARVLVIAHDIDLALLTVDDDSFWVNVAPLTFAPALPELYSEVKAVGYPVGGNTVSVTKGVVSRLDSHVYVHSRLSGITRGATNNPGPVLIIQIDAAINAGNSGGPTFTDSGEVVGVSSSGMPGAENVGYIIPARIVLNFLHEYEETKAWAGLPESGMKVRRLENKALRRFLMPEDLAGGTTGIQVMSISPLSPLSKHLSAGDMLLEIDGSEISKEATVRFNISGSVTVQMPFQTLITSKRRGASTTFQVLRNSGAIENVSVVLTSLPALAPRFDAVDANPSYVIVGGFVFTLFSTPLANEVVNDGGQLAQLLGKTSTVRISQSVYNEAFYRWRQSGSDDSGVVILLRMLKHNVNTGYGVDSIKIVRSVNGKPISSLASLVRGVCAAKRGGDRFVYFSFSQSDASLPTERPEDPDVVLELATIQHAEREILTANGIPAPVSSDLADILRESCSDENAMPLPRAVDGVPSLQEL